MRCGRRWHLAVLFASIGAIWIAAESTRAVAQSSAEQPEKYQWLEDVYGARSLAWVKAENERTRKVLLGDPLYAKFDATSLKLFESPDRLPTPQILHHE